MKKISVVVFVSFAFNCFAGNEVGNGGDVIVCGDSIELLDYYEARRFNLSVLASTSKNYISIVGSILKDFERIDLKLARQYVLRSKEIINELEFKSGVSLIDIPDSHHEFIPSKCKIEQIAIRRSSLRPNSKLFLINQGLWNRLSATHKAGLILHEIIYEHFHYLGEKDSKKARYMNGLISSTKFKTDSFSNYLKDLKSTEKKYYIVENKSTLIFDELFKVDLKNIELSMEGSRVCTKSLDVRANIKKVAFITNLHLGLARMRFTNVCFRNSRLESLTLPSGLSRKRVNFVMRHYLLRTDGSNGAAGVLRFNANGTFHMAENLKTEALYKMYYICWQNGRKFSTYKKLKNCKGPYLDYRTEIKYPGEVFFDDQEVPISHEIKIRH